MTGRIVLLGATGYTGNLVLEAVTARGLSPVLAGRNAGALAELARPRGLEHVVVDVTDPEGLRHLLRPGDVLVTTVGPFERFGDSVAAAAVEAGAHYIDSTGEVGFVRGLQQRLHGRAVETGSVVVPAFGYDYVPGILAGALAAEQGGDDVHALDIGYFATGPLWRGLSQGTRTTMRDGLTLPSARWLGHRLVEERTAGRVRAFEVGGRRRNAFLVSGTEVLFLPDTVPRLDSVTVYNGWFPALSRATSVVSALAAAAIRRPGGRKVVDVLTKPVAGPPGGPGADQRTRTRTHVVAVAAAAAGGPPLAEVHVEGPSIYTLTGALIAWAAEQLARGAGRSPGVIGPINVFGLELLRAGCAEVGLAPI
ncbi:saccharopine dehydrogenase family protein [Nocardia testacea]|uniref:saccharopine dehydrogenase family protein n=1 Tax=Nocardia testacea TaxID=248551 RepID=UPI003C2FDEA3